MNWVELCELPSVVICIRDSEQQVWHCVKGLSEKANGGLARIGFSCVRNNYDNASKG